MVLHGDRQVFKDSDEAQKVFYAFHDSIIGGHTGAAKTCTNSLAVGSTKLSSSLSVPRNGRVCKAEY